MGASTSIAIWDRNAGDPCSEVDAIGANTGVSLPGHSNLSSPVLAMLKSKGPYGMPSDVHLLGETIRCYIS